MSNKRSKQKLIELYGAECFIEKLHLRVDTEPRRYSSKGQYKRMKQLTYHHIKEKRNGGQTTVRNGALLSAENHAWFNKQSKEAQKQMNELFQKYKQSVECKVEFVDELDTRFSIAGAIIMPAELEKKYNRAREKRAWKKEIEEER
jgi:hypothetical protein